LKSSSSKASIETISISLPQYGILRRRVSDLLEETIASDLIVELAENSSLASWVNRGLGLHHGEQLCKFCNQPLPPGRLQELASHFNDQFQSFQTKLNLLEKDIDQDIGILTGKLPNPSELYEDLSEDYIERIKAFEKAREDGKAALLALKRAVQVKRERPFECTSLKKVLDNSAESADNPAAIALLLENIDSDCLRARFGAEALQPCELIISKHNERSRNHTQEVSSARRELERHEVSIALADYQSKQELIGDTDKELAELKTAARKLQEEISQLEKVIRSHRRPAKELTNELAAYLGNSDLTFEVKDTGYLIRRSGKPAMNLSEGERTAIGFLHFLKSLKDTSFNLKKGIVVIDDPVSSLDANSLYCAFGYMKEKTVEAEHLFILTHNFTMFRLVRNWFNNLKNQRKKDVNLRPARFYMLMADQLESGRASRIAALDPLLHEYESEYQYLFKCMLTTARLGSGAGSLAAYYGVSNIARRVLETFLSFKLPHMGDDLHAKLEEVTFDAAKKARILRFLHTHSHAGQIEEPEHDLSVLSETPAVLNDLLDLIKSVDEQHFNGMCSKLETVS
jgi:wobble nucleotide-excising tRNase